MTAAFDFILLYPFVAMVMALSALAWIMMLAIGTKPFRVALALLILLPASPLLITRGLALLLVHCIDMIRWPSPVVRAANYIDQITQ